MSSDVHTPSALLDGWLTDVEAAAGAGDWPKAMRLAERALSLGLEHPRFLLLRAALRQEAGRMGEARADLARAHTLDPEDAGVAQALGVHLVRIEPHRAARLLEQAAAAAPHVGEIWGQLGGARLQAGDAAGAEAAFTRAVEANPSLARAWGRLAVLASNRGAADLARERAGRALALDPHEPDGRRAAIEADLDQKRAVEAERGARAWLTGGRLGALTRSHALGLLADALEAQTRYGEAFEAYRAAKAAFGEALAPEFAPFVQHPLTQAFGALQRQFAALPAAAWGPAPSAAPCPARGHVFLLGFMRSGTTLLEQALSRHPDVAALEETEALAASGADHLVEPDGLRRIAEVDGATADTWRAAYWAAVEAAGVDARGKVLIDKLPFNAIKLPLIAKLFPEARILFAVRDPRDVVLSFFQRRLQPNAYSFEARTIEGAARLYAGYMDAVASFRAGLPLHLLEHRHEALLADVEASVREAAAFIGLDYRSEMSGIADAAQSGAVLSQSARQLGQGVNTEGLARWRRYAEPMAEANRILGPWVAHFGYPPT